MGGATRDYSIEQQELIDSGLRMLAQMIAAAHIRRIALRNTGQYPVASAQRKEYTERLLDAREGAPSENCHE